VLRVSPAGKDKARLRLQLALFFLALALPAGILIWQAWGQLKWEAFHQHRVMAEELAARVDADLAALLDKEQARPLSDYAFLNVAGDAETNFLQRSPLSGFPPRPGIPGLIGWFQVDDLGTLSTPLLPPPTAVAGIYGIPADELEQRRALQDRIGSILSENRLVAAREADDRLDRPAAAMNIARERKYDEGGRRLPAMQAPTSALLSDTTASGSDEAPAPADAPAYEMEEAVQAPAPGYAAGIARAPERRQVAAQAAFDRLDDKTSAGEKKKAAGKLGRVEDLKLDTKYQAAAPAEQARGSLRSTDDLEKRARKERSVLPAAPDSDAAEPMRQSDIQVHVFESEIDPLAFSLLDSGHFVLFRKVWRDGRRYIQGALIDQPAFLRGVFEQAFRDTALSSMSDLIIAFQGDVFTAVSGRSGRGYLSDARELSGELLYQTRLSDPLGAMQMIFTVTRMPPGPGARVIGWAAVVLGIVLCIGFFLMYRTGAKRIELARQQQDFVSAVSHELKTPLTSIRMYSEMLREGWADEEKKKTYYEFIHDESERLSRLVANVLQLARMTRNGVQVDIHAVEVSTLVAQLRSAVTAQVERAGFELAVDCDAKAAEARIAVDTDAFIQVLINLVDNAIKFSAGAATRRIEVGCRPSGDGGVVFTVRDYGPGIAKDQAKKIFGLFYRAENELTRETAGTGIGLALVHQLVRAMGGDIDVVNRTPGAEFRITFARRES